MNYILIRIISVACLLSILAVAGCVAPPEEKPAGPVDLYDPNQFAQQTSSSGAPQNILTEATLFQTTATPTMGYNVIQTTTLIPEDMVCLVDFSNINWTFESNKTAKKFGLKNPPMYINYSISKPFNVSGTRIYTSKYEGIKDEVTYSYYSPYSYFEITVRDPASGEIYTQDGFGKKYGTLLNKTIKVMKYGDLLIEMSGNNVTPSVGFWVKPSGNLDANVINQSALECRSQDYVKRLNQ